MHKAKKRLLEHEHGNKPATQLTQLEDPVRLWNMPTAHPVQTLAPENAYLPAAHAAHWGKATRSA